MRVNFKILVVAAVIAGIAVGVAFGAGYALGSPRQAAGGLTAAQIIQMYGQPSGGVGAGGAGGGPGALNRNPLGKITAMDASTITIDGLTGSQKLSLTSATTINRLSSGGSSDLKVGDTVVASGTAKSDGGFDATAVSQVPAELATFLGRGTTGGTGTGGTSAPSRTATPSGR
jgi:hypothetical protein